MVHTGMDSNVIETEFHRIEAEGAPYLIAEIGLNHNGEADLARRTIEASARSGASAVKFQLYRSDHFIDGASVLGEGGPGSLRDFFRTFELSQDVWRELAALARGLNVDFFCSVFDRPSFEFYRTLEPRLVKIASCDITNRPLLEAVRESGLPVLLSTGTADEDEIGRAIGWLQGVPLVLLQCVSAYPARPEDYNLAVLDGWRRRYGVPVGISDHCEDNGVSLASVALGGCAIERHFTLDRTLPGPDHALSLEPDDFARLAREARAVHAARGGADERRPVEAEAGARKFGRRALYLAREARGGAVVAAEDLIALRPGDGIGAEVLAEILGRAWTRDVQPGERLTSEMMEER